jgi:hypothetical protein
MAETMIDDDVNVAERLPLFHNVSFTVIPVGLDPAFVEAVCRSSARVVSGGHANLE